MNDSLDDLIHMLVRHQAYVKSLEKELERVKKQRDDWHEMAEPGWKEREIQSRLDGELRIMHQ